MRLLIGKPLAYPTPTRQTCEVPMNRHGGRYIDLQSFKSHANSLNVKFLDDRELEFYEEHCLLLPAVRFHQPAAYLIAVTQRNNLWPVANPEDLDPPEALRRLQRRHAGGLHPFDAERERNSLLVTPRCATFEPWAADDKMSLTTPDGHTVRRGTVGRYYAPWQVHVVEWLRQRKYYYVHSRFLRHIDPSHHLWNWHRLPEETEEIRSLGGMASGFEALERYLYADQVALEEAFHGVDEETLPESALEELHATVRAWSQRSLVVSGLDEPAFFWFLSKLILLVDDYRRDERIALGEDAEEYLLEAQRLARDAFEYDWDGLLAAAEEHVGPGLSSPLRRFDPVEAAADATQESLKAILGQEPVSAIAIDYDGIDNVPDEIVRFCLDHDLWEVLFGLQRYSYTDADLRKDRYPGFFHRGLRQLALAGEQLARGILDAQPDSAYEASASHHGKPYSELIVILGEAESPWLTRFKSLIGSGRTSDKQGDLDQRAASLTEAALAIGAGHDEVIANTLAAAVATRNLVSHRHQFLSVRTARMLGGPSADAVVLIWLLARERGLVS